MGSLRALPDGNSRRPFDGEGWRKQLINIGFTFLEYELPELDIGDTSGQRVLARRRLLLWILYGEFHAGSCTKG